MRFEDVILWHVYPLGFTGAEQANPPGEARRCSTGCRSWSAGSTTWSSSG